MGIVVDELAKATAEKIISVGKKSRERFLRTVPPNSWVWDDESRSGYGRTLGGQRIYRDHNDDTVAIGFIQGNDNVLGVWLVERVVKTNRRERRRLGLDTRLSK